MKRLSYKKVPELSDSTRNELRKTGWGQTQANNGSKWNQQQQSN